MLIAVTVATQAATFTVEKTKDGVTVKYSGKLFTRYIIGQSNKPFLWPVIGPSGAEMMIVPLASMNAPVTGVVGKFEFRTGPSRSSAPKPTF